MGGDSPLIASKRVGATQTPGGTGALRLSADFIANCLPGKGVWLSDPTWPIHETIYAAAGLKVGHYPYVGSDNTLNVPAMLETLNTIPEGDVVLLHACCHNPTGFDLSQDDWHAVLEIVKQRNLLPLIDFAYQGFGDGLEEDAWAVRLFAEALPELLITSSCSKSFGLYRERTGALLVCADTPEKLLDVRSQLSATARNLWSNPPDHGAAVVAEILGDPELKALWAEEVEAMRSRIAQLRVGLVDALTPLGLGERFAHIAVQRGMFSYTGMNDHQVDRLRNEHSVYMVAAGRANIAGIDAKRLDELAAAFAARQQLVRSDDMHEIPNFPFPSQTQQSAAARQELGQPIEMKAGSKSSCFHRPVHLHRVPEYRHPACRIARLCPHRPRLRRGGSRTGHQRPIPCDATQPSVCRSHHRHPRPEKSGDHRPVRLRLEWGVHAPRRLARRMANGQLDQPVHRSSGAWQCRKPGRIGVHRLGHWQSGRCQYRKSDFLEWHRQLRRAGHWCPAGRAAGQRAGAVEHGGQHHAAGRAGHFPGLEENPCTASPRRAAAVPARTRPCATPWHWAGAGLHRFWHHRNVHYAVLRQPFLAQRGAVPEPVRCVLYRCAVAVW
nr:aspartate aminotransferase [Tanacetum cinerariifolium]